jgi:hypothetical protein
MLVAMDKVDQFLNEVKFLREIEDTLKEDVVLPSRYVVGHNKSI